MRYLKGTIDFGLYYDGNHDYRLYDYTDADWTGSVKEYFSIRESMECKF